VLAVAAVLAIVLASGGGDDGRTPAAVKPKPTFASALVGPPRAPFALYYQRSWEKASASELEGKGIAAALHRRDRLGAVTVSVAGPLVRGGVERLGADLRRELRQRFRDLEFVTSKKVRVAGGTALYTSWVRRGTGRVQSNLVVPDGRRTYLLDATVSGTARQAAVEVGTMFQAFRARRGSAR
jgi:hypothetical protein